MNGFYMTPDYGYDPFAQMPDAAADAFGVAGIFFGIIAVVYLAMFAFLIVTYILQSLGMYAIAKRRGINNPWLAWLPVGSSWILGSISDQYQYVAKGRVCNRRKILLGMEIALYLLLVPMLISFVTTIIGIASDSAAGAGIGILVLILSYLAFIVLSIILLVFYYIALYDTFASCEPSNATTYLVLSIFFSVAMPFFIFFSRKKDLGMPPRKVAPQPAAQPELPVVEEIPAEPVCAEAPAEEAPVEEAPAEETPVEEAPAEEMPEETE